VATYCILADDAGLAKNATKKYDRVIASFMCDVGETLHLKDIGGTPMWIDANPRVRFERIQAVNRGRTDEDSKTYEEFLAEEAREMHPSQDADSLNMAGVHNLADAKLLNETNLEDLQAATVAALNL
jgi:hypothetical protein